MEDQQEPRYLAAKLVIAICGVLMIAAMSWALSSTSGSEQPAGDDSKTVTEPRPVRDHAQATGPMEPIPGIQKSSDDEGAPEFLYHSDPRSPATPRHTSTPPARIGDDRKIQKLRRSLLHSMQRLQRAGVDMEDLRQPGGDASECRRRMRANQTTAELLVQEAEQHRSPYGALYGMVARDLILCVSCLPDALEYCEIAAESMKTLPE